MAVSERLYSQLQTDLQERRLVFGRRGSNFGGDLGTEVPQRGAGAEPLVGILVTKPREAEETLQIVHVRKVFCVSRELHIDYCCSTQVCIQNVGLQYFASLSTREA